MRVRHLDGSGESELKYLIEDVDRYGNVRIYFVRPGRRKARLRAPLGSKEFFEEYRLAFNGQVAAAVAQPQRVVKTRAVSGSVRWLFERYYSESDEFGKLSKRTKHVRRLILDAICEEPIAEDDPTKFGDVACDGIPPKMIRFLRDRKIDAPEAGNSRVKALRQVFKFAVRDASLGVNNNPAKDVSYITTGSDGFHTWELSEVRKFEETHPVGTKPRLALAILLYLGVRRSDAVLLGKQHIREAEDVSEEMAEIHPGRWVKFTQQKNRARKPVTITIPILPELEAILVASPLGDLTWLVTQFKKGFSAAGFGNWFRDRCDEAGLKHCSAHGLRKAGAVRAAEKGATTHQLMAIFGWATLKEAERYTKAAEQQRLAATAMPKLVAKVRHT